MAQSRSGKKSTKNSSGKKGTASARGTGRSSTGRSASARSSAASRSRQPSRRAQRRAETPNLARSILLVGLGLLCVALVLVPGQNLWRTLRSWYFGVFGITTYLVGPFLLYLAYLLATGYRVALFAGKVSLMGVLCASVPVIFSKLNIENLKVGEIVKMLFTRGGTYFWEGGVLGAPIGATLLALFGRPASNIIMLLIFLLGLMFFFAITPADVVLFVDGQYKILQAKREERAAAETAYDTRLFDQEPEEESVENLTGALPDSSRPHHPVYDVIADTSRFPKQTPPAPQRQAACTPPVTPAVPEAPFAAKPAAQTHARRLTWILAPVQGKTPAKRPSALTLWSRSASARAARSVWIRCPTGPTAHCATPSPSLLPHRRRISSCGIAACLRACRAGAQHPPTPVTPAPAAQASTAPQDELDALINRAVSGHAPYYTPQEVSAENNAGPAAAYRV